MCVSEAQRRLGHLSCQKTIKTAKNLGWELQGTLDKCEDCAIIKGRQKNVVVVKAGNHIVAREAFLTATLILWFQLKLIDGVNEGCNHVEEVGEPIDNNIEEADDKEIDVQRRNEENQIESNRTRSGRVIQIPARFRDNWKRVN
jgi:hypothetical protein